MKCIGTLSHDCRDQGAFAPWLLDVDAGNARNASKARARSKAGNTAPGRPGADRVQRGRGWVSIDSTALSLFR